MISKKTAPPQAATPTAKPATRRIAAKKPVTKAALPATRHLPAAKKVAVKKTPSAKPAGSTRVATQAAQVSAITLTEVSEVARKPRPVRDSFTMPEAEYALLGELKQACLEAEYEVKKSELVRVGIALVARLDLVALKDLLAALEPVKRGRAKKA